MIVSNGLLLFSNVKKWSMRNGFSSTRLDKGSFLIVVEIRMDAVGALWVAQGDLACSNSVCLLYGVVVAVVAAG